jgi:hypothetical protein
VQPDRLTAAQHTRMVSCVTERKPITELLGEICEDLYAGRGGHCGVAPHRVTRFLHRGRGR